jgi:hypothetical protein
MRRRAGHESHTDVSPIVPTRRPAQPIEMT